MNMLLRLVFFFNDTATTEIYTLSLHDALPILVRRDNDIACEVRQLVEFRKLVDVRVTWGKRRWRDRKSTRLNSSHANISYAVFCLKKKKQQRRARAPVDDVVRTPRPRARCSAR